MKKRGGGSAISGTAFFMISIWIIAFLLLSFFVALGVGVVCFGATEFSTLIVGFIMLAGVGIGALSNELSSTKELKSYQEKIQLLEYKLKLIELGEIDIEGNKCTSTPMNTELQ